MPTNPAAGLGRSHEPIPFASWLDAIIPAIFPNDAEFARELGVAQSQVHRWRRGVVPQLDALVKMSRLTGTAVETLAKIAAYRPDAEGNRS